MFKRFVSFLLSLILIAVFVAPSASANAQPATVQIDDPALDQAIRTELGISGRDINSDDMLKLRSFYPKGEAKIKSLAGLEYATNLTNLYLPNHEIEDIAPLAKLTKLKTLGLNNNRIADVCPLAKLVSLQQLIISDNRISDFGCLSSLVEVTDLLAGNNQIADISSVKAMKKATWISFEHNRISDITPLAGLPNLEHIYLNHNEIDDIRPLLNVPELFDIHLENNPLNDQAADIVSRLQSNGATINSKKRAPVGFAVTPVFFDGERIMFDQPSFIQDGNTMVPFRPLFEKFGLSLEWNSETQTITGQKQGLKLELQIGRTSATVNGKSFELPVPPLIVNDATFVPTRFIGEALQYDVTWDNKKNAVRIYRGQATIIGQDGTNSLQASHSWKQSPIENNPLVQIFASDTTGKVLFVAKDSKQKIAKIPTLSEYYEAVKKGMESQNSSNTFTIPERSSFGGQNALQFEYRYKLGNDDFVGIAAFLETDKSFYRIAVITPVNEYEEAKKQFAAIVPTFKEFEPALK